MNFNNMKRLVPIQKGKNDIPDPKQIQTLKKEKKTQGKYEQRVTERDAVLR